MAPVFGTIDMLKPERSTFGLEVRLIRCYENSNSGGIECVFHDRQAERIHATIPGSNAEKFKDRLTEGSVYALIDFVIGLNNMKYRTASCIHKIIVFKHTRLFKVFHEEFPKCLFQLKTFTDITQMENVGDSAMGNTITCTVWEHYVDELIKFLDSGPEAPVGIIMQLCRANIFRGEVKVSTLFNVTKTLTDQKLDYIKEFTFGSLNDEIKDGDFELKAISEILSEGKGRRIDEIPERIEKLANRKALFNISVQPGQTRNYNGSFSVARICCDRVIIEKICGKRFSIEEEESVFKIGLENAEEMVDSTEEPISSLRSVDDNIDDVVIQKTIQEVIDEKKIGEFWIHATINSIESINRFSFLACKQCLKELQPQDELKFFCEQCQTFDICGKARYKLDVQVGDGTGETVLDMWDIQGLKLIEKKSEDRILDILPTKIDEILGAKGFFKIIVMHEKMKGPFTVVKVVYICDSLKTPPTMKSTNQRKNSADLINEDETNRKLIDEVFIKCIEEKAEKECEEGVVQLFEFEGVVQTI
ncbi:hypothetical protein C2S52_018112 [Perilla frutescens var. hirtella]|nr:hypothetical protein C2S52_018112 [Perilla frutescens var. hirtella]